MTQILLLIHVVSGCIPREGEAQSDQPSVAALWSGGAGIAANVCVYAVVPFRSRVPSHETIALNEDKTLNQLVTAPLQKHAVGSS